MTTPPRNEADDLAKAARLFLWLGVASVGFMAFGRLAPITRYLMGNRVDATVVGQRSVNYAGGGNRSSMCERSYLTAGSEEPLTIDGPCLLLTGEPSVGSSIQLSLSGDGNHGATYIEAFGIGIYEGLAAVLLAGAVVFYRKTRRT